MVALSSHVLRDVIVLFLFLWISTKTDIAGRMNIISKLYVNYVICQLLGFANNYCDSIKLLFICLDLLKHNKTKNDFKKTYILKELPL